MSTLLWRLLSMVGAFLLAMLLPLVVLVVVLGLVRTGVTGLLGLGVWLAAMVVLVQVVRRRRRHLG